MTTADAIFSIINSAAKLDAAIGRVTTGMPLGIPQLLSEACPDEPNPDIKDDLATQIRNLELQADSFFAWAQSN